MLNPGESEANTGLGKASVIQFLRRQPQTGLSHLDLRTQIAAWPLVLPYGPGHHRLALGDWNPSHTMDTLRVSRWLLAALDAKQTLSVACIGIRCQPGP